MSGPATRFVASFVGSVNVLPADRDANGGLTVWGTQIPGVKPLAAGETDVFVRPQRMRLVAASEPVGSDTPQSERQGRAEHLHRRPGRNHRVRRGRAGDGAKPLRRGDALRRHGGEGRLAGAKIRWCFRGRPHELVRALAAARLPGRAVAGLHLSLAEPRPVPHRLQRDQRDRRDDRSTVAEGLARADGRLLHL